MITKRYYDKKVTKKNGKLIIARKCKTFIDDTTDLGFTEYKYIGDLDSLLRFKVIQELGYNGAYYCIVDTKLNCQTVDLIGEPQIFGRLIVNSNESETEDRRPLIEIWRIEEKEIKKITTLNLYNLRPWSEPVDVEIFKIANDGKIMFKDFYKNKYWKINCVFDFK